MKEFRGKVVTISDADERGYHIKEDRYHWTDEMFSGIAAQYHIGDRVLVRSALDDLDHAPAMMALAGTEVTIIGVNVKDVSGGEPGYSIAEDDEMWVWHDSDFAGEPIRRTASVYHTASGATTSQRQAAGSPDTYTFATSVPTPAVNTQNEKNEKESSKMKFNFKRMLSQYMPRSINDGSVALSISGDIAYRRKDGDYVFYDPESKSINNCMDLVLGSEALDKMVFVMPTKDIHIGDVILNGGKYIYITNITEAGTIKGVSLESGRNATLVKEINAVMGCCPYAKVTSLFTMMNDRGGEGINPMFLMLLNDSDNEDDLFTTIAMMTMMGGNAAAPAAPAGGLFGGGMNPLMLMALSGDDDDEGKGGGLTKMLMFSQMMGGGLFQAPAVPAAPAGYQGGGEE